MFKNKVSIIKKIAKADNRANKRRNIFIIITIILATCMLIVIPLYFIEIRQQFKNDTIGRYQAVFVGINENQIYKLKLNDNIENLGLSYQFNSLNINDYKLNITYMNQATIQLNKFPNIDGRLPESKNEVVVESNYLKHINSNSTIGDKINLEIDNSEKEFIISGILPLQNSTRSFMIIPSNELVLSSNTNPLYSAYIRIKNSDHMDEDNLKSIINKIGTNLGIESKYIVYSSYYFALLEQNVLQDLGIILAVGILIALVCMLVIYNLYYISLIEKINQYGSLRVIGATKKQIKKIVLTECSYLCYISIIIGIFIGVTISYILVPKGWNINSTIYVCLIVSFIIYISVIISIYKPVKIATKISPIEAMHHISYDDYKKNKASKKLHRKITPLRLSFINLNRNPKKTIITIISLSMCGMLLMCSSAYLNSINFNDMAKKDFPYGELKINLHTENYDNKNYLELQRANFLNEELLQNIFSIDGVENIKEYLGILEDVEFPSGKSNPLIIDGYKKEDIALLEQHLLEGTVQYETLTNNNGVIVLKINEWKQLFNWDVKIGDTIYVQNSKGKKIELKVMGIVDQLTFYGGNNFLFVPDTILKKLENRIDNFNYQIAINSSDNKIDYVENSVRQIISSNPNLELSTLKDMSAMYKYSLNNQKAPIYILTIFIGFFGIINLINTLITNILTRKKELSAFQILGLENKQLSQMLIFESIFYSFYTILITLIIGTPCGYLLCKIFNTIGFMGNVIYHFPILELTIYFILLIILQMLSSIMCIKIYKNQSLVERIRDISI